MRIKLLFLACFLFTGLLCSCGTKSNTPIDSNAASTPTNNISQSNPYFVLFEQIFADDPGLNTDIKYIAVDLAGAMQEDSTEFLELMKAFCEDSGYTLLEDNVKGLEEKGLIKDSFFEEGVVISFEDTSLTEKKLVTNASKWRSGLGAIGGAYTLTNQSGVWSITDIENQWVS
ncbi:MAG: hypothetical protein LBV08_06040 [Clostridiales bacterium]|jgi:hypothetical protein|nr:hypothetical protein [Clostridiales bacterium]